MKILGPILVIFGFASAQAVTGWPPEFPARCSSELIKKTFYPYQSPELQTFLSFPLIDLYVIVIVANSGAENLPAQSFFGLAERVANAGNIKLGLIEGSHPDRRTTDAWAISTGARLLDTQDPFFNYELETTAQTLAKQLYRAVGRVLIYCREPHLTAVYRAIHILSQPAKP